MGNWSAVKFFFPNGCHRACAQRDGEWGWGVYMDISTQRDGKWGWGVYMAIYTMDVSATAHKTWCDESQ